MRHTPERHIDAADHGFLKRELGKNQTLVVVVAKEGFVILQGFNCSSRH